MPRLKPWLALCCLLSVLLTAAGPSLAAQAPVGRLLSVQGQVGLREAGSQGWRQATAGQTLHAGDALATGPSSKAAVLCVDESQIKLNENTTLILKAAAPSARLAGSALVPVAAGGGRQSRYDVPKGEVWVKNEAERFRFELSTPAMTAAIRGTEFVVRVEQDGASSVALLRGALTLFNAQGEIALAPGEIGSARPGQAPTKQVLVNPLNAVQWTLYYPAVADPAWLAGEAATEQARAVRAALARAGAGDVAGAYAQAAQLVGPGGANPGTATAAAYIALMAGEPAVAGKWLEAALAKDPRAVGPGCLAAQLALFSNRRDEAAARARAVVAAAPGSPLAQATAGLTAMAAFDLPKAREHFRRALELDPGFVAASVYLARIELGSDELDAAWRTMQRALSAAPGEAVVQATAGFVRLGFRDFGAAEGLFRKAADLDPGLGEARLGLGYVAYSRGQRPQGLEEMLAATLLSPRLALLQSALGKALYQNREFDKALATYDYAAALDPADPTPHLYKGIALADLNRPGEAIQEISESIARNDNQAMFRSRLTLDRDLAVRNVDLARAFNMLGQVDRVYSKALSAVKDDPLNPSARRFLSSAYTLSRQQSGAAETELLLSRLLSPANQNAFSLSNDYTPMFETPYARLMTLGSAGFWGNGNAVRSASLDAYGGQPGMAAQVYGTEVDDDGMRRKNSFSRTSFGAGLFSWEFSPRDALSLFVRTNSVDRGDNDNLSQWSYRNAQNFKHDVAQHSAELGYVHRFTPGATLITYLAAGTQDARARDASAFYYPVPGSTEPLVETYTQRRTINRSYVNLQAQQQNALGPHTLLVGGDFFQGSMASLLTTRDLFTYYGFILGDIPGRTSLKPPDRSGGVYALDYWKLAPGVVAELGLGFDAVEAPRTGWADPIRRQLLSPRLGLNWRLDDTHTLRLAFQRYLVAHASLQPKIAPADVAGFASRHNSDDGSAVSELGAAWESQWNDKTFTVARLSYTRVANPQYDPSGTANSVIDLTVSRALATVGVNRILTPSLGLYAFGLVKRLKPDDVTGRLLPESDFLEADAALALNYLHESGFGARVSGTLVHQHHLSDLYRSASGGRRQHTLFGLLDAQVYCELPGKRGVISLSGTNLTGTRFDFQREIMTSDSYFPERQVVLRLELYF